MKKNNNYKKIVLRLLYLIAIGIVYGFEAMVLILSFVLGYITMDLERAIYGVILVILIIPIAWKLWPTLRQEELQKIKDIYEEEKNNF
jgi:cell shape-determining protein MreD